MAPDRPMTELGTIDLTALERVVGGEASVETGNAQMHMAIGIGVGVVGGLIDRYERKAIAARGEAMVEKLTGVLRSHGIHLP
jgi:hypothetical protein